MGFYDRDYYRPARRGRFGGLPGWSVTTWLIVINVAVFVLDAILNAQHIYHIDYIRTGWGWVAMPPRSLLPYWGEFSEVMAIQHLQLWRFITFQFLHAGLMHLGFNMLALYFFGPMVEDYLGRGRYLAFYLLCGMAGAASYLSLWALHLLVTSAATPLVGASAGIFGVLIAAAMIAPNVEVLLMGIVPMPLRTLAWLLLLVAVFKIFTQGTNAGGEAAHLGGAALGFLLIKFPRWLNVFDFRRRRFRARVVQPWDQDLYR